MLFAKLTATLFIAYNVVQSLEAPQSRQKMIETTEPTYNQTVLYRAPASGAKAMLVLLHGCNHFGSDWEYLPVERTIVAAAVAAGYAAVAVSAKDNEHHCWMGDDADRVAASITHMQGVLQLPSPQRVYLLGASSGGSFAFEFAYVSRQVFKIHVLGVCVQISSGRHRLDYSDYKVPVLFVHMTRDKRTAAAVGKAVRALVLADSKAEQRRCAPKSLKDGDFFFSHGEALTLEDSRTLTAALLRAGYIAQESGLLKQEPRMSDWREIAQAALPHIVPLVDSLVADRSPLAELMNLAWASHEITDEHIGDVLEFFDSCLETPV